MKHPNLWRRLALALVVVLPVLLGGLYFTVFAVDRYVSTSVVTVRRAGAESPAGGGLALLLGAGNASSLEDARYLRDFVHSLALFKKLDASMHLRDHFGRAGSDPFYRLWPQAGQEWAHDYWRSRVEVALDELSGLLTLRVQGFEPAFAQRVNAALLAESEAFVNDISQRIAQEQMGFARAELTRAETKLEAVRGELLAFQGKHQMLDPVTQAQASGALAAELRAQLAKLEAEISSKRGYLNEDSPEVVSLKGQAAALRLQVSREARGATEPGALGALAQQYQKLKAQAGFAEDGYKAALASLETARLDAARKVKSLVVIEPPTEPETAEYPRRIYAMFTLLVACALCFALVRLGLAVIDEHRP